MEEKKQYNKKPSVPDVLSDYLAQQSEEEELNVSEEFILEELDGDEENEDDDEFGGEEFSHLDEATQKKYKEQYQKLKSSTGKKIRQGLDFKLVKNCATCCLCRNDPEPHEIYRRTNNVQRVVEYLNAKYGSNAPSLKSVYRHINHHFKPIEDKNKVRKLELQKEIASHILDIRGASTTTRIQNLEAILYQRIINLSMVNVTESDLKQQCEVDRTLASIAKSYQDCIKLELNMAGMDVTPEEMRNRVKSYMENWMMLVMQNETPEDAKKIMDILMKNRPTEGL